MSAVMVGSESGIWIWLILVSVLIGFAAGVCTVVALMTFAVNHRARTADLHHIRASDRGRRELGRVIRMQPGSDDAA